MISTSNISAIDKPHSIGRPTSETVYLRQKLHQTHKLLNTTNKKLYVSDSAIQECHQKVITLEQRMYLMSNAIQSDKLRIRILERNLNLLARL